MVERGGWIEKQRVGFDRIAALAAHGGIGNHRRRLDQKTKVRRHLAGVALVLSNRQRLVESAVDTDAAKHRVLRIRLQPVARQL